MRLSTDRILTTHVGSLPRPQPLVELLAAGDRGPAFEAAVAAAVAESVRRQAAAGIDIVNDGETGKLSYVFYLEGRVAGIGPSPAAAPEARRIMAGQDLLDHPDFQERHRRQAPAEAHAFPACLGPLAYADEGPLRRDIAKLKAAIADRPVEGFMTAASPGVLTKFVVNLHYPDEDAYVEALAGVMKREYEAIAASGLVLQIDCPDLGSARHNQYRDKSEAEFRRIAERNVAALNWATASIPPERMRLHLCWGNYEGPHTHDIPLARIIDICLKARPMALSFEGANPRHEHEWEDLAAIRIPDDKVLIPGVIDSTTNFVEHPRLVAQRLGRYADLVGRERVIAGVDCGFATFARMENAVATSIVWAKLAALAEGARIASRRLWG